MFYLIVMLKIGLMFGAMASLAQAAITSANKRTAKMWLYVGLGCLVVGMFVLPPTIFAESC